MVLSRHPKKYKHLIRIMLTQLVQYESITTTRGKGKHLKPFAQKLLTMAKKAEAGQKSALNLLQGKVHTQKAKKKLLVDLMPRIKHLRGGFIHIKNIQKRRRGDNAPMVQVSIKGTQKHELVTKRQQQYQLDRGVMYNPKTFKSRILLQQKQYFEQKMKQNSADKQFFQQKIAQVQFKQWILNKNIKQPPKYTLLV